MFRYIMVVLLLVCNVYAVSGNETTITQNLLNSYHFTYEPQLDVFDCVDMSIANLEFLQAHKYETRIAILEDGFMPNGTRLGHCMAIVKIGEYWMGVETKQAVIDTSKSIGKLIGIDPDFVRVIYDTPEEVYKQDIRKNPPVIENAIEKNV
jgi:hypothetical protein